MLLEGDGCERYSHARLDRCSRIQAFDELTWLRDFEGLLPLYDLETSDRSFDYLLCVYKGFNQLSNITYDRGLPGNASEMVFAVVVMVVQTYITALILGTLLNYLVQRNPVEEEYQKKMDSTRQYLQGKKIPLDLQERVFAYFEFQHRKNVQNSVLTVKDLPQSLSIKVANAKYKGMLEKTSLRGKSFQGCSKPFFNTLATLLKTVHVMPGEEVVRRDEIPRELYMVHVGSLSIVDSQDRCVGVVRNDMPDMSPVAGEIPFFLGINYVHTIMAHSDGDVQLAILTKEDSNSWQPLSQRITSSSPLTCCGAWISIQEAPLSTAS